MIRLQRFLLLVVMFALPLQGAMATSRLCMALMAPASADTAASDAHRGHGAPTPGVEHHGTTGDPAPLEHAAAAVMSEDVAPTSHDSSSSTCKHCAACTLTVAVAPDFPALALLPALFTGHLPIVVPVPHNTADGLERPPRTI